MKLKMKKAELRMKKWLLVISAFILLPSTFAANWYVRPNGAGAKTGADWNNAWDCGDTGGIVWSSLSGGDTVWFAGGTYNKHIHPTKSGSAGNLITLKRVLSSDSTPTSAAGWNSSFDSQVIIQPGDSALYWDTPNVGSYLYIDGRQDSGIKLTVGNVSGTYPGAFYLADGSSGQRDITVTNVDMAGPGGNTTFVAAVSVVSCRTWNGSAFGGASNITFAASRIHGGPNLVLLCNAYAWTFDNCRFYDNNAANASSFHPNLCEFLSSGNITWKNCDMTQWAVEGIMPYGNATGPIYIYGCVWHDPYGGTPRIVEIFTPYTVFFYNNTIVNVPFAIFNQVTGTSWQSSAAYNNIVWNSAGMGNMPNIDYNFTDGNVSGVHSIIGGSNPFVNYAGGDYHIISTVGSKLPRDKGNNLGSPYNVDKDGNTRGADGTWDIGAYEYPSGGGSAPVINSSLTATATNGIAFTYQITATGSPNQFGASPLPSGLSVNGATGLISGTPSDTAGLFNVTITATNASGHDNETLALTLNDPAATIGVISTNTLYTIYTNGTQDRTFTVTNTAGAGTLNGSASVSSPFSIVGNATYALTTGHSTNITVRFSPSSVNNVTNTLTFTGGGGATISLAGLGYPVFAEGAVVSLTNALVISPLTAASGYISQSVEVQQPPSGGIALFGINFTNATTLTFTANLNAPNSGADSFWINVDADTIDPNDPTDVSQVWDVIPDTTGFEDRGVGWRGNGTFNAPQFPTNTWSVTSGIHLVYIRGREANAQWKTITSIIPPPAAVTPSAPLSPSVLSVNASNVFT